MRATWRALPAWPYEPRPKSSSTGAESHPGLTCYGRTTVEMYRFLRSLPGTVYVPLVDR